MALLANVSPEEGKVTDSIFKIDISLGTFLKVKFSIFKVRRTYECHTALPE